MISERDRILLLHIRDAVSAIEVFAKKATARNFETNLMLSSAVERQLEIIGEATKNLSAEFKRKNKGIEWRKVAGLRDVLIHDYIKVDKTIVYNIVKNHLPQLSKFLKKIL